MESRHDSENAERILFSIQRFQLLVNYISSLTPTSSVPNTNPNSFPGKQSNQQTKTVYWILAASKGWIKQTYRKILHTQSHITGNDLVKIE